MGIWTPSNTWFKWYSDNTYSRMPASSHQMESAGSAGGIGAFIINTFKGCLNNQSINQSIYLSINHFHKVKRQ